MALQNGLLALVGELRGLREMTGELCLAVIEDRPAEPDVALVDRLEDRVTDLEGAAQEALDTVLPLLGRPGALPVVDVERVGEALARSQNAIEGARAVFWDDLASYDALAGLVAFVREQGGEWTGWMETVHESLHRCRAALADASRAQSHAWQEIVDRAAQGGVHVRTTTVGQQLTVTGSPSPEGGVR